MRVVAFDCETTGLDPKKHSIIELAAFSFDLMDKKAPTHLFHRYVIPEDMVWTVYCLNLHKELLPKLMEKIIPWDEKCETFTDFDRPKAVPSNKLFTELLTWHNLLGYKTTTDKKNEKQGPSTMIGAGKNFANFDWPFMQNLPNYKNIFKHRSLDPSMSYLLERDEVPPDLAECKRRAHSLLGVSFPKMEVSHTAVDDCMDVVTLLQYAYEYRKWAEA